MTRLRMMAMFTVLLALACGCGTTGSTAATDQTQPDTKVRPADEMTMVYVPGGEFRMGTTWSLDARVHTVALDSFWIDQTEVTNAHYGRCVAAGACSAPATCAWGEPTYEDAAKADHPVICVTWQAARAYCEWAGGRLPTEAEWEYAARGPDSATYPWGDEFDGTQLNSCDVNCPHEDQKATDYDDGHARTAPVGSYPSGSSWCGALDMAGNVWEWVADWHGPYPFTRQTNPAGPESGSERLIRGGSWFDYNEYGFLRADNRHPFEPRAANDTIGFRCVMPVEEFPAWRPVPQVVSPAEPTTATPMPSPGAISSATVAQIEKLNTLSGHTDRVLTVVFSPDGALLASGSVDGIVKLWNVESGQEVSTFEHSGGACLVVFSPDGTLLASGGLDHVVKLWNLESGQQVHTFDRYDGSVCALDFSPDGSLLATGSIDKSVKILKPNGQEAHNLAGHTTPVFTVAFSPDGLLLASGSARPEFHIKLWDVESGQEIRTLVGQETDVHGVAFSPDGALLASVGPMAEVKLWDVESGQVMRNLLGHNGNVFGIAFSVDGTLLASSSDDGTMKLWDVETGRVLRSFRHGSEGSTVAFSPDGSLLASDGSGNTIILWGIPR